MKIRKENFKDISKKISWRISLQITFFTAIAFSLLSMSTAGDFLEINLARKLEFTVRGFLDKTPKLHPKIKIFVLDDQTTSEIKSNDFTIEEWTTIIEEMAEKKPAAIFINKVFGLYKSSGTERESAAKFIAAFKKIKKTAVGCFVTPFKIDGRPIFPFEKKEFEIKNFIHGATENTSPLVQEIASWIPIQDQIPYGPSEAIIQAFDHVGHITIQSYGYTIPFFRVQRDYLIPHLAFYVANTISIGQKTVELDGTRLYLDNRNRVPVNFVSFPESFHSRAFGLRGILKSAKTDVSTNRIEEGDIVVILTQMYTGNTDFHNTAVGDLPGGFIFVSLINSVLKGEWLRPINANLSFTWGAALLGLFIGNFVWIEGMLLTVTLVPLLLIVFSVLLFTYFGLVVPWLFPLLTFFLTVVVIFVDRFRKADRKSLLLRESLRKAIPPDRMEQILRNPSSLQLEATHGIVTMMFIEVVGFASLGEKESSREIFDDLRELFSSLRKTVQDKGGVFDKSLSGSLLCFFGNKYEKSDAVSDLQQGSHAARALECAIVIQKSNLERCRKKITLKKHFYPLRIGINTATVHIGDLGEEHFIDFGLVGPGVVQTKCIEQVCELFKINFSVTTSGLFGHSSSLPKNLVLKKKKAKYQQHTYEFFEYDPLADRGDDVSNCLQAFAKFVGLEQTVSYDTIEEQVVNIVTQNK